MKSDEIREQFLGFFKKRGHTRVRSSSLIPAEDPTLLFVNAGMNQFKDIFLGLEQRDYTRAVSSQKCVRAGGKHNDLDNVGHTARHLTFFEMLGNFSFGDYFKKEAVEFAWELLTKDFAIPEERLWITVFQDDDETARLWKDHIGVAAHRILRMDEDNFWQMGDTGPCGPCSELHYDFGPEGSSEGHADCRFPCECGRYMELWNLVFMQFDRDSDGKLEPLPNSAIDTGMGLERIAAVLQGKMSNFETDLLGTLVQRAAETFGVDYGRSPKTDVSLRIVADHVRSSTFLIGDGVIPSNEGRGYVLRKIMRRAIRQGTLLGRSEPFLHTLTGVVVDLMKGSYPDLVNTREYVARVVESEEERFRSTVAVAVEKLEEIAARVSKGGERMIAGSDVFKLYDTYGLPIDFIEEIAGERGLGLDTDGFTRELERQRERTRESWKGSEKVGKHYAALAEDGTTRFLGYETTRAQTGVRAILIDGQRVEVVQGKGAVAEIVLDETPFYSEGGGQVGDTGGLTGPSGTARVLDTVAPLQGVTVHKVELEFGEIRTGDTVDARVDAERRRRIAANHTGTHLLHAVLRSVLGTHVKQSGSLVAPDRLRFDYTHYQAPSEEQVAEIEATLNQLILENHPVVTREMDINQAIDAGAIAFFGEKYQQTVRVVSIPEVSMELCGGTHTRATGDIGLFKIVSESGIAAGVRRVEALTGMGSFDRLNSDEELLEGMAGLLRSSRPDLLLSIERLLEQNKTLEAELARLKRSRAATQLESLEQTERTVGGVRVVSQKVEDMEVPLMRELAEAVRANLGSGVVVLGTAVNGKAMLVTAVSKDLQDRLHAGTIVKSVARMVGGSGGGRADFAQAGGKEPEKLDEALEEVYNIVAGLVS